MLTVTNNRATDIKHISIFIVLSENKGLGVSLMCALNLLLN